jgi:hypothetical protein
MNLAIRASFLALLLVSCNTGGSGENPQSTAPLSDSDAPPEPTLQPAAPEAAVTATKFIDGPNLKPSPALRQWLSDNKGRTIRLPFAIRLSGFDVGPAWIGMDGSEPGEDTIHVSLDQGALGVGLLERLGPLCDEPPSTCVVWLQGKWGPTVSNGPSLNGIDLPGPHKEPFSVRDVVGRVQSSDTATVKIAAPNN